MVKGDVMGVRRLRSIVRSVRLSGLALGLMLALSLVGCSRWIVRPPTRDEAFPSTALVPGRDIYAIEWRFSGNGLGLPGKPVFLFTLDFGTAEKPRIVLFNPVLSQYSARSHFLEL
jgi:hypothetical protein